MGQKQSNTRQPEFLRSAPGVSYNGYGGSSSFSSASSTNEPRRDERKKGKDHYVDPKTKGKKNITHENCVRLFEESMQGLAQNPKSSLHADNRLSCLCFLEDNWAELTETKEQRRKLVEQLSEAALKEVLLSDHLTVNSELDCLLLLGSWAVLQLQKEEEAEKQKNKEVESSGGSNDNKEKRKKTVTIQLTESGEKKEEKKEHDPSTSESKTAEPNLRGTAGLYGTISKGVNILLEKQSSDSEQGESKQEKEKTPRKESSKEAEEEEENEQEEEEEEDEGPRPVVNLRGTKGLFASMEHGVKKALSESTEAVSEKEQQPQESAEHRSAREKEEEMLADVMKQMEEAEKEEKKSKKQRKQKQRKEKKEKKKDKGKDKVATDEEGQDTPFLYTNEFTQKLREKMSPLIIYIRFPMLADMELEGLEAEKDLIPVELLTEAVRQRLSIKQLPAGKNPTPEEELRARRLRSRNYNVPRWDDSKKSTYIGLSENDTIASLLPSATCSVKRTIVGSKCFSSGRNTWSVELLTDPNCHTSVGVVGPSFSLNNDILGVAENSWALCVYPGPHHSQQSTRRNATSVGTRAPKGTIIDMELDLDAGTLKFFRAGALLWSCTGLKGPLYPAASLCHGTESIKLR
ncbi:Bromodomain containing 4 [Balamuthia mandrillaris]